jgi:hypothetical protein
MCDFFKIFSNFLVFFNKRDAPSFIRLKLCSHFGGQYQDLPAQKQTPPLVHNLLLCYPHSFTSKFHLKKNILCPLQFTLKDFSFYSTVFRNYEPLNPTSISNYPLFYIITYNYHLLFLLSDNNIVHANCESQFLKF